MYKQTIDWIAERRFPEPTPAELKYHWHRAFAVRGWLFRRGVVGILKRQCEDWEMNPALSCSAFIWVHEPVWLRIGKLCAVPIGCKTIIVVTYERIA